MAKDPDDGVRVLGPAETPGPKAELIPPGEEEDEDTRKSVREDKARRRSNRASRRSKGPRRRTAKSPRRSRHIPGGRGRR